MPGKKILLVSTSNSKLGDTGKSTGLWLEELASPYYVFRERGIEVTIASVKGGEPPVDEKSVGMMTITEQDRRFQKDEVAQDMFKHSVPLTSIDVKDYDAVFFAGGHGTVWDFGEPVVTNTVEAFYNAGKIIGAVCHGPVALIKPRANTGQPIVSGKKLTAFSNSEEDSVGLSDTVPFKLETSLVQQGAQYSKTDNWGVHAVRDGNLITGQNPASATRVADYMCEALGL